VETSQILFAGKSALRARAFLLGSDLICAPGPRPKRFIARPLAVKLDGGMAVLFRYGVAVLPWRVAGCGACFARATFGAN